MGRLKCMPPRLASAPPKLASVPIDDAGKERERNSFNPLRHLYNTTRWKALRLRVFERDGYTCQMCGRLQGDTSQLVADHSKPHRGDLTIFWDEASIETLCNSPCHSKHKQRIEQGAGYR